MLAPQCLCTNAATETYLEQKFKNASLGPIPKAKQSALIKEWENIIAH